MIIAKTPSKYITYRSRITLSSTKEQLPIDKYTERQKVHTLSLCNGLLLFTGYLQNQRKYTLPTLCLHAYNGKLISGKYKIFPPTMKRRYFQFYLTPSTEHLAGYKPYTSTYSLHMSFPIRLGQNQIPYPERKVIRQLCTQKIYPVRHKLSHGKMAEKFIGILTNPFFTLCSFCVNIHQFFHLALTVRYYHIIRIGHFLKERYLARFVWYFLPLYQKAAFPRPLYRLIPHLRIGNTGHVFIFLPCLFAKGEYFIHEASRLVCRYTELPPSFLQCAITSLLYQAESLRTYIFLIPSGIFFFIRRRNATAFAPGWVLPLRSSA